MRGIEIDFPLFRSFLHRDLAARHLDHRSRDLIRLRARGKRCAAQSEAGRG